MIEETSCKSCDPGSYQNASGQAECKLCSRGSYQDEIGKTICKKTDKGRYQDKIGETRQILCKPGSYQDKPGQTECKFCSPGSYQDQEGQTVCTLCDPGKYQDKPGQTECTKECEVGTSWNPNDRSKCDPCKPGTYQDKKGQLSCISCGSGKYQNKPGQTECKECPDGFYDSNDHTGCAVVASECTTNEFKISLAKDPQYVLSGIEEVPEDAEYLWDAEIVLLTKDIYPGRPGNKTWYLEDKGANFFRLSTKCESSGGGFCMAFYATSKSDESTVYLPFFMPEEANIVPKFYYTHNKDCIYNNSKFEIFLNDPENMIGIIYGIGELEGGVYRKYYLKLGKFENVSPYVSAPNEGYRLIVTTDVTEAVNFKFEKIIKS